jgi:hypothetical protein
MQSFLFNYDSIPYGIQLNPAYNRSASQEITFDTDFKTISKILADSLIEIVKKSFETTAKSFKEANEMASTEPIIIETE